MAAYPTLAAVDLGSNSFRLQVARVMGDQLYPLDSLREPVRLAGGLKPDKRLDEASQERALACLKRFGERLRGLPRGSVRAVGTNTLRVAKNGGAFLRQAEAALGFPIEVIAGREEARLIYIGVAHGLPPSQEKRLVVDVGGGSTEFIIGAQFTPRKLESLYMGCVSYSLRYFPEGRITKNHIAEAELAARSELQTIIGAFSHGNWKQAIGSSGTARALADVLRESGFSTEGITPRGLARLRAELVKAGSIHKLALPGLSPDRAPVLPGGFAILSAVVSELGIECMAIATGSLREGMLYDLIGRFHEHDMRELTVRQFMRRYHVDPSQAKRVQGLAVHFLRQLLDRDADAASEMQRLDWAARLHEIGISIAYNGYHKHSAYIVKNADMPGFSRMEQERLAALLLAHRGSLKKMQGLLDLPELWLPALALRLAVLASRSRTDVGPPPIRLAASGRQVSLYLNHDWAARHPMTLSGLESEIGEWRTLGITLEFEPKPLVALPA
jgi:exopolyphosphatase/guanosine-5'-triphosphate,3'-diphosphate pyrophosphatase